MADALGIQMGKLPVSNKASVPDYASQIGDINVQMKQNLPKIEEGYKTAAEVEGLQEQRKQVSETAKLAEEARGLEQYRKTIANSDVSKQIDQVIEQRNKPFVPTQESSKDLMNVFTLTTLIGFALGGMGKQHAQQAVSAMNGMLEGHTKGREDLYKREKDVFDENSKALDRLVSTLQVKKQEILELAKTDYQGAQIKAEQLAIKAGAPLLAEITRKQGVVKAAEYLDSVNKQLEKQKESLMRLYDAAERRKEAERTHEETRRHNLVEEGLQRQRQATQATSKLDDFTQMLEANGVHIADKQAREKVANGIGSAAELKSLQKDVQNNPALVGRQGQIAQFTQRWITSFNIGGPEPTASQADQEALLFAKKYASMLTRYELALAGSGRSGSTVAFQKRYNDLLSQNQFDAPSLVKLFDDMQDEVKKLALEKSKNLVPELVDKYANDINNKLNKTSTPSEKPANIPADARKADDGHYYVPDPNRPGKYLRVD